MGQSAGDGLDPKGKRAKATRSPRLQDAKSKLKISAYLSLESARRLGIHATMTGQDKSAIIDALIKDHLRDWVVQYRPNVKGAGETGIDPESQAG